MKEGIEPVEIFLSEGVKLVVMAASAVECLPKPDGSRRFDSVCTILRQKFFGNDTTFFIHHMIAVKSSRDLLRDRGLGQQISGDLFHREIVEFHVRVEGFDHPISPGIHVAVTIDLIAVGICKSSCIEPIDGHALTVVRGVKIPVDPSPISLVHSKF